MEGGVDGILVNDGLACEVDEHRAGSEERKLVGADHAHGVRLAGHVEGQVVATAAKVFEGAHALHVAAELPGMLDGDEGS